MSSGRQDEELQHMDQLVLKVFVQEFFIEPWKSVDEWICKWQKPQQCSLAGRPLEWEADSDRKEFGRGQDILK